MTVQEFIKKYNPQIITWGENKGKLRIPNLPKNLRPFAAEHKPEILEILQKEQEEREKKSPYNIIEGLEELQTVQIEWNAYLYQNQQSFGMECRKAPKEPKSDLSDLKAKYPRAAAYLYADSFSDSRNVGKSGAGQRAKKRILTGEDPEQVLKEMEAEWTAYCMDHQWD